MNKKKIPVFVSQACGGFDCDHPIVADGHLLCSPVLCRRVGSRQALVLNAVSATGPGAGSHDNQTF